MPPVRIPRDDLTARLAGALDAGSVVLTAGAGFGKSTALELALDGLGRPVARVSCDGDGDAGQLLARLVGGIREAVPGVADEIGDRLAIGLGPVDLPATTATLVAELERLLVDPLVVVVDDAESLAGDRAALAVVGALLAARTERLHVAVASRRPLRLRRAKLRAAGRLAELGEADLAFSPAECAEYLRQRLGRAPDPDELEALVATTKGWPLGVALGAAGAGGPNAGAPRAPAELFAFLAEEVLDRLPSPLRDQVLVSAVASELDTELLAAIDLPADLAAQVREAGLFVEPGSAEGRWRYHPLLHEFLFARVRAERDDFADLCARAAAAEKAAGRPAEAVRLLLAAGRHEEAAATIAEVGPALVRTSWQTVRSWLDALPDPLRAMPPLRLLEGQILLAEGEQERGVAALLGAEEAFREAGIVAGEWAARWWRAASFHEAGEWGSIARLADDFDEGVAAAAGPPALALGLYGAFGKATRGDVAGAEALLARVNAQPGAELLAPIEIAVRAYLDFPAGRIDDLLARGRRASARLEHQDVLGMLPALRATVALMLFETGRTAESLEFWDLTVADVQRLGANRAVFVHAQVQRAVQLARLGRVAEAERALSLAEPLPEMGFRETWVEQARAAIAWRRGDAGAAVAACRRAYDLVCREVATADRSWAMLSIVPVLADLGETALAREYVEDTLGFWDRVLPGDAGRYWRGRTLSERAWLRFADGEHAAGVDDLRDAWHLARGAESHLLRVHWHNVRPLLWAALEARAIDPAAAIAAVRSAAPSGEELAAFLEHPEPAVQAAAITPAAASGHPRAYAQLRALAEGPEEGAPSGGKGNARAASAPAEAARRALARVAERPPPLTYTLLGGFGVRRGEWDVEPAAWSRPATAALVRYLLVHRDAAVPEDDLFEALWPGRAPDTARSSLRVALSRARSVLDPPGAKESRIVGTQRTYRLRLADGDRIDSEDFGAAAAAARAASGAERVDALERAADLWTGEPLPEERYADWALIWRNDLIDRHIEVLSSLARARLQAGDNLGAIAAARRLVDADPLNEESHVQLMLAHARAGNRSSALRQYLALRGVLVDELGLEPSVETQRLHRALLAGEPI